MSRNPITALRNWCRARRHDANPLIRFFAGTALDFATFLHAAGGFLTQKQARAVFFTRLLHGRRIHQTTPATGMNRFPAVFGACQAYFDGKSDIRILSFGCSTGEEVFTLRRYFPDATIVGAEINPHSLSIARQRNRDQKIHFIESTAESIQNNGPYDAIFCMAVFQRTPQRIAEKRIRDLTRIYPFSKFEDQIVTLDGCLNTHGLMVVHFSQYAFADTRIARNYRVYGSCNQNEYSSPIFDRNSRLITEPVTRNSIFIKDAGRSTQ